MDPRTILRLKCEKLIGDIFRNFAPLNRTTEEYQRIKEFNKMFFSENVVLSVGINDNEKLLDGIEPVHGHFADKRITVTENKIDCMTNGNVGIANFPVSIVGVRYRLTIYFEVNSGDPNNLMIEISLMSLKKA